MGVAKIKILEKQKKLYQTPPKTFTKDRQIPKYQREERWPEKQAPLIFQDD